MRIHFVKPLRIIMLILIMVITISFTIYIYLGFTNKFPSKEVYLAAILFPVLIAPIITLLIINLKILKNNKIKRNKTHNALCIVNFILLPVLVIAGIFSLTTFICGGHGHSYTDKYSDYLTLMNEEPYKSNLPCFEEKEIQKFKYYENSIDSHQEDFFVVLEYDNEDQFINSLNRIKAFMPNYKTEINKFNDSYQDIINSNKMNSYEMKKVNNTYEIIGEYLVISYETNSKRIVISYWNFLSDEFISDHNPYLFEYFEYIL